MWWLGPCMILKALSETNFPGIQIVVVICFSERIKAVADSRNYNSLLLCVASQRFFKCAYSVRAWRTLKRGSPNTYSATPTHGASVCYHPVLWTFEIASVIRFFPPAAWHMRSPFLQNDVNIAFHNKSQYQYHFAQPEAWLSSLPADCSELGADKLTPSQLASPSSCTVDARLRGCAHECLGGCGIKHSLAAAEIPQWKPSAGQAAAVQSDLRRLCSWDQNRTVGTIVNRKIT